MPVGPFGTYDDPYMLHQRELQRHQKMAYEQDMMRRGFSPFGMQQGSILSPAPTPASPNLVLLLLND